jgi:carboxyl-terminal processing protease
MIERRKALALTAVLVFFSSLISFYAGAKGFAPQLNQLLGGGQAIPAVEGLDLVKLQRVYQYIQGHYVEPITSEKLTEGALRGMVEATGDKYSTYLSPTEYKRMMESFKPTFSGIGVHVELSKETGLVTIVAPIKGSPGAKAGLRSGDAITAVDGKELERGVSLETAVGLIKGPSGTAVKLTIRRSETKEPFVVEITRAVIQYPTMESKMIDPEAGIGYVQLIQFNEELAARLTRAVADLQRQGMKGLILDLRHNPGGLLQEAVNVSSVFVPAKQPVVHIVDRSQDKETHVSTGRGLYEGPLVVLVDEGSASASEIVAGAIKDLKLGTLMGVKTFGKGSVQSFDPLPDGGGVKLTTARYLTAGGTSIHQKGIEPDLVVKNPEKVLPGDPNDVQLQEAITYMKKLTR